MINWLVFLLTLYGTYLNLKKNPNCFVIWCATDIYWTVHNYMICEYAQCFQFGTLFFVCIWGMITWDVPSGGTGRQRRK